MVNIVQQQPRGLGSAAGLVHVPYVWWDLAPELANCRFSVGEAVTQNYFLQKENKRHSRTSTAASGIRACIR